MMFGSHFIGSVRIGIVNSRKRHFSGVMHLGVNPRMMLPQRANPEDGDADFITWYRICDWHKCSLMETLNR
jgi:hypothetical protein